MPAVQRRCAFNRVMSTPWSKIWPASASKLPVIRLKSVDLPAPLGPMIPTASPAVTAKSMPSAALTEPKDLERRRVSSSIVSCKLGRATRLPQSLGVIGDSLHLTGNRDLGRGAVVGDDDVVLVAVLKSPLTPHERRLGHVLGREWWHALAVPLHLADDGVEVGGADGFHSRLGIADLLGALEHVRRHLEQRVDETDRLRPLLLSSLLVGVGELLGALFG